MSDVKALHVNAVTPELVLNRAATQNPKAVIVMAIGENNEPTVQWSTMPLEQVTWLQAILDMAVKEQLSRILVRHDPR